MPPDRPVRLDATNNNSNNKRSKGKGNPHISIHTHTYALHILQCVCVCVFGWHLHLPRDADAQDGLSDNNALGKRVVYAAKRAALWHSLRSRVGTLSMWIAGVARCTATCRQKNSINNNNHEKAKSARSDHREIDEG